MSKTPIFTGCGTAMVTPFKEDGTINFDKMAQLIDLQYEGGTRAIVINGTTYVFDPNFENENPGRNGYQITYGQSGTWKYTNWTRVD